MRPSPQLPASPTSNLRALDESLRERDALEKRVARLEKAKDEQAKGEVPRLWPCWRPPNACDHALHSKADTDQSGHCVCHALPPELRDQLESSQAEMRAALRARDDKVASLLEELGRAEEQVGVTECFDGKGAWLARPGGASLKCAGRHDKPPLLPAVAIALSTGHNRQQEAAHMHALRFPCTPPWPTTAQSETLRHEMESAKADLTELEELRELKADVERKERQQAVIIEGQVCLGRLR